MGTSYPIEELRAIVAWCNWQYENWWLPFDGRNPTIEQIIELYHLCRSFDVETPECLQMVGDEAEAALDRWVAARGNNTDTDTDTGENQ
jgi:hypothetical protein